MSIANMKTYRIFEPCLDVLKFIYLFLMLKLTLKGIKIGRSKLKPYPTKPPNKFF
jgi:hypothetical protein